MLDDAEVDDDEDARARAEQDLNRRDRREGRGMDHLMYDDEDDDVGLLCNNIYTTLYR